VFDFTSIIGEKYGELRVLGTGKITDRRAWLKCECSCGIEQEVESKRLLRGDALKCTKCYIKERRKYVVGDRIGKRTVMALISSGDGVRCLMKCDCGNEKIVTAGVLRSGSGKRCKICFDKERRVGGGWVFWLDIVKQAKRRSIEFDITYEEVRELLKTQRNLCALTGVAIEIASTAKGHMHGESTASLDRIDSSLGYLSTNIQWVHKVVNMMKQALPEDKFIAWCKAVAHHADITIPSSHLATQTLDQNILPCFTFCF
jgi:hypothetical protein